MSLGVSEPVLTEEQGTLTFVTEEVDTLKLLEATGVCRGERSEAGAQYREPRGTEEGC